MSTSLSFEVVDWGLIDYSQALIQQKEIVNRVIAGGQNQLILCEHPPILTLGRLATEDHFLIPKEAIDSEGISIKRIDRGGEVTLHAPGQLVCYPIINLNDWKRDLHLFLRELEEVAIDLLKYFGIVAHVVEDYRGVWVHRRKIVSIGVGVKKWVTYHGMAINVTTDLKLFQIIRPCGLDVAMTSIKELTKQDVKMSRVKDQLAEIFLKRFA